MDFAFNRLTQLALGYWQGQCLFALADHRIFDLLTEDSRSAHDISVQRGLDPAMTERLLDAGVALGLLAKSGGCYENSPLARRFLLDGLDDGLSHWVRTMGQWVTPWAQLPETVRTGCRVAPNDTGGAERRDFILGMHEFAQRTAAGVPDASDLHQPRQLVDVGGGAGTYSIAFCRAFPNLHATILDLPDVLDLADEVIARSGVADRISSKAIDYRLDSFGHDVDVILFSNVLHQEAEDVVVDMLERGVEALVANEEGRIVVHGHFLSDDHTSPMFSTLHNLSAKLLWGSGRSYTAKEMQELMHRAGLVPGEPTDVSGSTTQVIVGAPAGSR